jgi:hypothetical protein
VWTVLWLLFAVEIQKNQRRRQRKQTGCEQEVLLNGRTEWIREEVTQMPNVRRQIDVVANARLFSVLTTSA